MKRLFRFLLFALLSVLLLSGCEQAPEETSLPSAVSEAEYAERKYNLSEISDSLKLIGRVQTSDKGLLCDFTASGFAFNAYLNGTVSLTVTASLSDKAYEKPKAPAYFTVFVDGERLPQRFSTEAAGESRITFDIPGEVALHEIRIVKQTESVLALTAISSLEFYGALASPPDLKEIYIEFIGDSVIGGYGNLCADGTANAGSSLYQDGTSAYAFLTAERLEADCSVICRSGIGVADGWEDPKAVKNFYFSESYHRNQKAYDFTAARVPDAIVINLGTNDAYFSAEEDYKRAAAELITEIRSAYGKDVPIVWVYNMMGDCCLEWTQSVLDSLGGEAAGLFGIEMDKNKSGGDGHPDLQSHEDAAKALSELLKEKVLKG